MQLPTQDINFSFQFSCINIEVKAAGPRLNIKTVLSTYGDFHVKDKTAVMTSYLYHGNRHTR